MENKKESFMQLMFLRKR
nr:hypothetical protein [Tanacetum cinerariifolium]